MDILAKIVQIIKWTMAIVQFKFGLSKPNNGRTFTRSRQRSRTTGNRPAKYYRLHSQLDWSLYCGPNAWNWGYC